MYTKQTFSINITQNSIYHVQTNGLVECFKDTLMIPRGNMIPSFVYPAFIQYFQDWLQIHLNTDPSD